MQSTFFYKFRINCYSNNHIYLQIYDVLNPVISNETNILLQIEKSEIQLSQNRDLLYTKLSYLKTHFTLKTH